MEKSASLTIMRRSLYIYIKLFIPYKKGNITEEFTYIFFKKIFNNYKLLKEIINNKDKLFIL